MSSIVNVHPILNEVQAVGTLLRVGGSIVDKVSQHWNQGKQLTDCKCQLEECQEQLKQLEEQQQQYREKLNVSEAQREENEEKLRLSEEQRQLLMFFLFVLAGIVIVGVVNYKLVPRSLPA